MITQRTRFAPGLPSSPSDSRPGAEGRDQAPLELTEGSAARLATYCLVWVVLWSLGLLFNNLLEPLLDIPLEQVIPWSGRANLVALSGIALSLVLYREARRPNADSARLLNLAIGYQLITGFAVGIVNQTAPERLLAGRLSWICVLILIFPMIVPTPPKTTLWTSLVTASMDPVGIAVARAMGKPVPQLGVLFWSYFPNYVCAGLAMVPAGILTHLNQQVRKARELGSYRLDALIGRGGMGEVWRASHRMLARPAAIKLIRPETLDASGGSDRKLLIRRFRREAEAAASLHSPHTIKLYDFGVNSEGTFYFVMELLNGIDLETLVERHGPLPAERVVHLLTQVCHSLAEAHAAGLVHRDVKPSNIFVCRMGLDVDFVKVLDFGLVKAAGKAAVHTIQTAPELTTGTPAYMAPEVALGEGEIGPHTDIYSVGCVAYYLLTGQLVFEADTPLKMVICHLQNTPTAPSRVSELEIPAELDDLVLTCLRKKPGERPSDMLTLARLLAAVPLHSPWTHQRANHWWNYHEAEAPSPPTAAEPTTPLLMPVTAD